jgi:hypothetical protein
LRGVHSDSFSADANPDTRDAGNRHAGDPDTVAAAHADSCW